MPFSIEKSPDLIRVTYSGTLTEEDIQEVIKYSIGGTVIDFSDRLEDMRNLHSVSTGFAELMEVAANLRTVQLPHVVKTALLTNNSLQFGVARMFQTILDHPQMKLEIFTSEQEAMKWLEQHE